MDPIGIHLTAFRYELLIFQGCLRRYLSQASRIKRLTYPIDQGNDFLLPDAVADPAKPYILEKVRRMTRFG